MKRILIDTNIYSAFKRNDSHIVRNLQACKEIHINVTVLAELLAGFKGGSKELLNQDELRQFLDSPRIYLDLIDEGTAEFYAHIYLLLRTKGAPIPTNDIWVAASAMQHGLALFTKDSHFKAVDGLLLV